MKIQACGGNTNTLGAEMIGLHVLQKLATWFTHQCTAVGKADSCEVTNWQNDSPEVYIFSM